jgi:dsDNA-specific endonuclease/ATPase MutS2
MTILEWLKRWRAGNAAPPDGEGFAASVDEEAVDPFNPFPDGVRLEITDIIDLHTVNPREVRKVVEEYLLEARARGFRSVRIIHGKGVGVQREIVRGILERTPFVRDWMDAPPQAGGGGATIAHLSTDDD